MPEVDEATVQEAKAEISSELIRLEEKFHETKRQLAIRKAELLAVEANHAKIVRAINAANAVGRRLQERLKKADIDGALRAIETAVNDSEEISLEPLKDGEQIRGQLALAYGLIKNLTEFFLPEAAELVLVAQREVLLAESLLANALAAWRELKREIALSGAVALEGQIVIDEAKTVSGELRLRAAQLTSQAESLWRQIQESQENRKKWPL
jgi:hypothetical protein